MPLNAELDHASEVLPSAECPANSPSQLQARIADNRLSWPGPMVVLPARIVLMLLAQALVAAIFLLRGAGHPWLAAAPWWTVYATLIDIGCLTLLWKFTHREGMAIRDLVGSIRLRYGGDILLGIGCFLLIFPLFVLGGLLSCRLIYGAYQVNAFPGILGGRILPFWAVVYSRFLWWILWSPTEEIIYNGYLLPRVQALSHRTWFAIVIVGFVWAIQHSFLPFVPEWRNFIWRFLAFVPGIVAMMMIYLRIRRLAPLILAHWAMDIIATMMTLQ